MSIHLNCCQEFKIQNLGWCSRKKDTDSQPSTPKHQVNEEAVATQQLAQKQSIKPLHMPTSPALMEEQIFPCETPSTMRIQDLIPPDEVDLGTVQTFQYNHEGQIQFLDSTSPYFPEVRCQGALVQQATPKYLWDVLGEFYRGALAGMYHMKIFKWRETYHLLRTYPIFDHEAHVRAGMLTIVPCRYHFFLHEVEELPAKPPPRQTLQTRSTSPPALVPVTPQHYNSHTPENHSTTDSYTSDPPTRTRTHSRAHTLTEGSSSHFAFPAHQRNKNPSGFLAKGVTQDDVPGHRPTLSFNR